ncbi:dynein axonemal light chain 4 [Panulirus ornatus]|uniref:dynein axonemal light chain 4 n=1 Tax=Panulirus ornatus TaxID=150431 RepID=UPI003A890767
MRKPSLLVTGDAVCRNSQVNLSFFAFCQRTAASIATKGSYRGLRQMAELRKQESVDDTKKIIHTYPLLRHTDMSEEMKTETMELIVTACEKYQTNNESAARVIKETMDKRYGATWHCVVGEAFGFEVSYEVKNLLYMFFAGNLAIAVWKCC